MVVLVISVMMVQQPSGVVTANGIYRVCGSRQLKEITSELCSMVHHDKRSTIDSFEHLEITINSNENNNDRNRIKRKKLNKIWNLLN